MIETVLKMRARENDSNRERKNEIERRRQRLEQRKRGQAIDRESDTRREGETD